MAPDITHPEPKRPWNWIIHSRTTHSVPSSSTPTSWSLNLSFPSILLKFLFFPDLFFNPPVMLCTSTTSHCCAGLEVPCETVKGRWINFRLLTFLYFPSFYTQHMLHCRCFRMTGFQHFPPDSFTFFTASCLISIRLTLIHFISA